MRKLLCLLLAVCVLCGAMLLPGCGSGRTGADSRNGRTGADGRIARTGAAPRDEKTTAARFENQKVSAEGQKSHLNKAHRISIARRPKPEEE